MAMSVVLKSARMAAAFKTFDTLNFRLLFMLGNIPHLGDKVNMKCGRMRVMFKRNKRTNERAKDLVGRRVQLLHEVRTGRATYAVGTEMTVSGTWRGRFHLEADDAGGSIRMLDRGMFAVVT